MKKPIIFSVILIGVTAISSQILLTREFLTVFYGNEFTIGVILSVWLLWGAVGSIFLGRLLSRMKNKKAIFSLCQLLLGAILIIELVAIRFIKPLIGISPGEAIAFSPVVSSVFIISSFLCIILGFMFSLACQIYEEEGHAHKTAAGFIYYLESIGSIIGGLLCSFIFVRLANPFQAASAIFIFNIIASFFLMRSLRTKETGFGMSRREVLFLILLSLSIFIFSSKLQEASLKRQWRPYNVRTSVNSIYSNIIVTQMEGEYSFFANGLHLYTVPDRLSSEEAVHFALLEHPEPKRVLLIGAGAGGLLDEILKHPVEKIDYVELDPLIIELAKKYLPANYTKSLDNPKVSIKNLDGRFFVKNSSDKYDCIITHLGDPHNAQLNRFYTVEFFKEANRLLNDGGILSFSIASSENYISPSLGMLLTSIYRSLRESFAEVKVIPGDNAYFLACNKKGELTYDYKKLMQRKNIRKIDLEYVREYYLASRLSAERLSYFMRYLNTKDKIALNYDFKPSAYYYDMAFWSTHFNDYFFKRFLNLISEDTILKISLGLLILIFMLGLVFIKISRSSKTLLMLTIGSIGFSSIIFQVVILIAFEVIYGHLFYNLGFIITAFMSGLAAGSFIALKNNSHSKKDPINLLIWQIALCIYAGFLPVFLAGISGVKNIIIYMLGSNLIFPFFSVIAGLISGYEFSLINKICAVRKKDAGSLAGLSYGIDLFGSCLGAILAGVFFIPLIGVVKTCILVLLLNLIILLALFVQFRKNSLTVS